MEDFVNQESKISEFEAEALEHIDSLFNFGMRMTGSRESAEDLVQETYLKVHRFSHTFKEGSNLKAWLFRILRNTFINTYRKKIKEPKSVHYDEVEDFYLFNKIKTDKKTGEYERGEVSDVYEFLEDEVKNAVNNLPLAFREVVLYSDIEELSYGEISEIIGCPIGTVKSRLFRARKLLQKSLWNYANERGFLKERHEGKEI
ncbi:DNA-directed RNA polymerase specialized sigma subunit [Candidatus Scalindua japonica]|uniref:DNA-directed RNA polymerase specialized sigma subunit n=1 Tax=Candidatus Scalindua japonica TaxID=1284222 RepID=A0A286TWR3_9BACT|nr:sigma-70 family RNA polymerase sigma factor [Candidatus Scalindua japonica]GAX60318.1 DNA-directed RNA polymerase specialized sigma subunit [Candidatus Scalindua japonica]